MDEEQVRKRELMDWIVAGMAGNHYQKPTGFRADREPDASWYRPSTHRPGDYVPEAKEAPSEAETRERCETHRKAYDRFVEGFLRNEGTLSELNEQIRILNNYFVPKGCPALPEIGAPAFSRR